MSDNEEHKHHILPFSTGILIFFALIILTIATVATGRTDLGALAVPVAMAIALAKAALVVLFFMGLKYDDNENRVIFVGSIVFCLIFFVLTASDVYFRTSTFTWSDDPFLPQAQASLDFEKPWEPRDELIAHGQELYNQQCMVCHGAAGQGNGPAAAGLNPKPRSFVAADGWKNGRKVTEIYGTLVNGLNTMPAFTALPPDDLFALSHYVRSFGDMEADKASEADLRDAGIDPTTPYGGLLEQAEADKEIPVDFAVDRYIENQ